MKTVERIGNIFSQKFRKPDRLEVARETIRHHLSHPQVDMNLEDIALIDGVLEKRIKDFPSLDLTDPEKLRDARLTLQELVEHETLPREVGKRAEAELTHQLNVAIERKREPKEISKEGVKKDEDSFLINVYKTGKIMAFCTFVVPIVATYLAVASLPGVVLITLGPATQWYLLSSGVSEGNIFKIVGGLVISPMSVFFIKTGLYYFRYLNVAVKPAIDILRW